MEDVVVFAALAWEAGVVLDGLQAVDALEPRVWRGFLGDGAAVRVCQTGIGMARAAAAADRAPAASLYLSIGCSGALVGGLHTGDIVIGEGAVAIDAQGSTIDPARLEADGILRWAALRGMSVRRGRVVSSPVVLETREQKLAAARAGASVVDMECVGIVNVARRRGIPVGAVKVVLDELGDGTTLPHADVVDVETGDVRRGRAVLALATRPRAWASTLRLAHQQRVAESRLRAFVAPLFGAGLDGLGLVAGAASAMAPA